MTKKIMTCLIGLAFVCSSLLFFASCASQQVQVSEGAEPTKEVKTEEPQKTPAVTEEKKAEEVKEVKEVAEVKEPEKREALDEKQAEADRLARQRELEKAQRLAEEIRVFESENIFFDFDKSELKPESMEILKIKAGWLRDNPSYSVRIEGNCDERGTNEYNLALGERRAYSAMRYLVALGISAVRISTISCGEERPADPRSCKEAWAKNRRDEFKLVK